MRQHVGEQVVSPVSGFMRYRSIFSSLAWSPIQYRQPSFSFHSGLQKFFLDQSSAEMTFHMEISVLLSSSSISSGLPSVLRTYVRREASSER